MSIVDPFQGVTRQVKSKTFICRISKSCKRIYLGSFKTELEAFEKYKQEKEKYVKEVAKRYFDTGDITKQIFNSLMSWRLQA